MAGNSARLRGAALPVLGTPAASAAHAAADGAAVKDVLDGMATLTPTELPAYVPLMVIARMVGISPRTLERHVRVYASNGRRELHFDDAVTLVAAHSPENELKRQRSNRCRAWASRRATAARRRAASTGA